MTQFLSELRAGLSAKKAGFVRAERFCCILLAVCFALTAAGCSRGYISSYSDNISRSSCSLTAVSADFSGVGSLYAEHMAVPGEGEPASVGSVYAAGLFDLESGRTIAEENITERHYPASITKIMTALLAIKYGKMDDVLVASKNISNIEWDAQKIGVEPGDTMTLEQALNYLMVYSANDAADMIAEHIGKNYDDFVRMMNEEAARLGATNTHFVNSNGLHDDDHYTTAYDLFLIFQECLRYPMFRELMDQSYYSTIFHNKDGEIRAIEIPSTDNYLTGASSPPAGISVLGGKTGTTSQAGSCLIILSRNSEGREYVSVVLGASDHSDLYVVMNRLLRLERNNTD